MSFLCAFAYVNILQLEIKVNITKKVFVVQTKSDDFLTVHHSLWYRHPL